MNRQELLAIAEHFSAYNVQFSTGGERFDIINPFGKDSISVYTENDSDTPYTVCFSFNHVHLETPEQVIAYVNDIIGVTYLSLGCLRMDVNVWEEILIKKKCVHFPMIRSRVLFAAFTISS